VVAVQGRVIVGVDGTQNEGAQAHPETPTQVALSMLEPQLSAHLEHVLASVNEEPAAQFGPQVAMVVSQAPPDL